MDTPTFLTTLSKLKQDTHIYHNWQQTLHPIRNTCRNVIEGNRSHECLWSHYQLSLSPDHNQQYDGHKHEYDLKKNQQQMGDRQERV